MNVIARANESRIIAANLLYQASISDHPDAWEEAMIDIIDRDDIEDVLEEFIAIVKDHRKELFCYLVTFTLKPSIQPTEYDKIQQYIISQFRRPPLKVVEAHIVREMTQNNVAHWHVAVSTNKWLKKDRLNYYIKKYGKVDISKSKHNSIQESMNYISKVDTPTKIA